MGRVDDVINVSGHRIGTAEVESALVSHPDCAEAAVVPVDHPIKGQVSRRGLPAAACYQSSFGARDPAPALPRTLGIAFPPH